MSSFKKLYEADKQNVALDQLKAEVQKVNKEFFSLLDKYTYTGLSLNNSKVAIITEKRSLQWLPGKDDGVFVNECRKNIVDIIDEYARYYNYVIKNAPALKDEKVLSEEFNPKRTNSPIIAFGYIEKIKFSIDIETYINSCKELYNYLYNDINILKLSTSTNQQFAEQLAKIKTDLGSMEVKQLPDNKIESDLNDVPEYIINDYKGEIKGKGEEDMTNPADEQGNYKTDTAGSKPTPETPDEVENESLEDQFMMHNFLKRLNDKFL